MSATDTLPAQIDTALADLHGDLAQAVTHLDRLRSSIIAASGARYYYRGRQRVTDRTFDEAVTIVREHLATNRAALLSYGADRVEETLDVRIPEAEALVRELHEKLDELNAQYTGWSRFFLVTSSQGHVHSSMHCSTCRPTTTYGWLPELSGRTEAEAVEAHGPALCSVCFPSAPVEWTAAKITKAQAAKRAA